MYSDWRLTDQMKYLYRKRLTKEAFVASPTNDHEHCEFCWSKFGKEDNLMHWGYCTTDKYRWICEKCYYDFRDIFEWSVDDN